MDLVTALPLRWHPSHRGRAGPGGAGQGRARNRLPTALVSAVVCGAGLLTGLTAVEFGTSAARIMGALLSLVALGVFAAVAWAASSRPR